MICPKCGFEQPDSPECLRCGIVISRYKGPVPGATPRPASPPAAAEEFGNETILVGSPPPPPPPVEAGGTLYGGPAPAMAAAGGGTLYGGPLPPAGTPSLGRPARPTFHEAFNSGKILGETFSIYFSNFLPFALLTALALSPVFLFSAFTEANAKAATASLLPWLLSAVLCPNVATAAITYGVFQQMRGRDTSIGDCLSRGLSSLLSVLVLALIQGILVLIGVALCIVPGILLTLRWAVSVPSAVEEQPGIFGFPEAMRRSTLLTDGYRGDIFGVLFVLGALNIGSGLVINLALKQEGMAYLAASSLQSLVLVGLSATASAVMYYRLRSIKESIDVDQIASVFA